MTRPPPPVSQARSPRRDTLALATERLAAERPLRKPRLLRIQDDLRSDRIADARGALERHLARHPDDADALNLMAQVALRQGRRAEAASWLSRCLEAAPDFARARFNLAGLLFKLGELEAALDHLDRLLACDANPLFLQMKASILEALSDSAGALLVCRQLTSSYPQEAGCWLSYGNALRAAGAAQEAVAAYRTAIEVRPSCGLAYWSLANMKTVRFGDDDLAAMRQQLERADVAPDDRIALQFALGRAYEAMHAYERSFEHYAKGNAALRLRSRYDPALMSSRVAASKALYTPEFLAQRRGGGCPARDAIFILGQPRSGSTLVEQILCSHSAVEGTAELAYVPALVRRIEEREGTSDYRKVLARLDPDELAAMGEEYLARAKAHRRLGRPFFIDKTPGNYWHVGLIHLILPNARIVDVRRHPADCSLSVFKHYFAKARPRLNELGGVYRDYVELMAHFDRVLPGRVQRVIYEELVADPQQQIRRLLDGLGLPFEDSCLRFHETERPILTPSSEQVRRPITAAAIGAWRHYEPWIGPLIESLGSVLTAYPSVPEELR